MSSLFAFLVVFSIPVFNSVYFGDCPGRGNCVLLVVDLDEVFESLVVPLRGGKPVVVDLVSNPSNEGDFFDALYLGVVADCSCNGVVSRCRS